VSALGDRRFRRLLVGQALSSFGDSALYLSLAIWAKDLTGSNAAAGAVFFALGLPMLFAPLAGQLVDRVNRRRLLIATNTAAGVGVLALLLVHSRAQLWILYAVAAGYGVTFALLSGGMSGLLKDLLRPEELAGANASFQAVGQGLRLASPPAPASTQPSAVGRWPCWTRPPSPPPWPPWPASVSRSHHPTPAHASRFAAS